MLKSPPKHPVASMGFVGCEDIASAIPWSAPPSSSGVALPGIFCTTCTVPYNGDGNFTEAYSAQTIRIAFHTYILVEKLIDVQCRSMRFALRNKVNEGIGAHDEFSVRVKAFTSTHDYNSSFWIPFLDGDSIRQKLLQQFCNHPRLANRAASMIFKLAFSQDA